MTGQRKRWSLFETIASTAIGFTVTFLAQFIIYPIFSIETSAGTNFALASFFTIVSILRGYFVRRLFNWIEHGRDN